MLGDTLSPGPQKPQPGPRGFGEDAGFVYKVSDRLEFFGFFHAVDLRCELFGECDVGVEFNKMLFEIIVK